LTPPLCRVYGGIRQKKIRLFFKRLNARKIVFEIFRALVDARDVSAYYWVEILYEEAF
jgi:hypothetical protein